MLKGINHSIIEVNETGSEYYERAILIIRPEYASAQRAVLEDEARRMLRDMDVPSALRSKSRRLVRILTASAFAAGGILIGCILSELTR